MKATIALAQHQPYSYRKTQQTHQIDRQNDYKPEPP